MSKNPSFRCSDEFDDNMELAVEALGFDNKSDLVRHAVKELLIENAGEIVGHHDDVDGLKWGE